MIRVFLALVLIAIPWLSSEIFVRLFLNSDLSQFVASSPNDLPEYWHEVATFAKAGWNGGYYSLNEIPAPWSFFHFGFHGPIFPALYGTFAKLVGWEPATFVYFNIFALTLSLAFFVYWTKPNLRQLGLAVAIILAFWPLHVMMVTSFQESFHQAAAIVLACLYFQAKKSKRTGWLLVVALFLSLIRMSWALLLPWLFYSPTRALLKSRIKSIHPFPLALGSSLVGLALVGAVLWVSSRIVPPGGNSILSRLGGLSYSNGWLRLLWITFSNLNGFISGAYGLDFIQRLQIFSVFLFVPILWLKAKTWPTKRDDLFHWYNLTSIMMTSIILYLPEGYYRVFAPHLLLSLFLAVLAQREKLVIGFLISCLLGVGLFPSTYKANIPNFSISTRHLEALKETLSQSMVYRPSTDPWCNTVLVLVRDYDYRVTAIPPGFGISFVYGPLPWVPKSKYLIMSPHDVADLKGDFQLIGNLPKENLALFRNADSKCTMD